MGPPFSPGRFQLFTFHTLFIRLSGDFAAALQLQGLGRSCWRLLLCSCMAFSNTAAALVYCIQILKFDNSHYLCYAIMGSAAAWKYTVYKICSCHSNAAACQILAGRSCMGNSKFDSCPAGCSCLAAGLVAAAWGAAPGCQILERAEFWALGKFWKVKMVVRKI